MQKTPLRMSSIEISMSNNEKVTKDRDITKVGEETETQQQSFEISFQNFFQTRSNSLNNKTFYFWITVLYFFESRPVV